MAMASLPGEASKARVSVGEQSPFSSLPHGDASVQPSLDPCRQDRAGGCGLEGQEAPRPWLVWRSLPHSPPSHGLGPHPLPTSPGCWSQQEPDHTFPSLYHLLAQMWGMETCCAEAQSGAGAGSGRGASFLSLQVNFPKVWARTSSVYPRGGWEWVTI